MARLASVIIISAVVTVSAGWFYSRRCYGDPDCCRGYVHSSRFHSPPIHPYLRSPYDGCNWMTRHSNWWRAFLDTTATITEAPPLTTTTQTMIQPITTVGDDEDELADGSGSGSIEEPQTFQKKNTSDIKAEISALDSNIPIDITDNDVTGIQIDKGTKTTFGSEDINVQIGAGKILDLGEADQHQRSNVNVHTREDVVLDVRDNDRFENHRRNPSVAITSEKALPTSEVHSNVDGSKSYGSRTLTTEKTFPNSEVLHSKVESNSAENRLLTKEKAFPYSKVFHSKADKINSDGRLPITPQRRNQRRKTKIQDSVSYGRRNGNIDTDSPHPRKDNKYKVSKPETGKTHQKNYKPAVHWSSNNNWKPKASMKSHSWKPPVRDLADLLRPEWRRNENYHRVLPRFFV